MSRSTPSLPRSHHRLLAMPSETRRSNILLLLTVLSAGLTEFGSARAKTTRPLVGWLVCSTASPPMWVPFHEGFVISHPRIRTPSLCPLLPLCARWNAPLAATSHRTQSPSFMDNNWSQSEPPQSNHRHLRIADPTNLTPWSVKPPRVCKNSYRRLSQGFFLEYTGLDSALH